ncbi:MAG TPA: hypothetical protein VG164_02615 [Trebonia sp.]|jgi:hypothetical protein|nr:hypothetical protein [Trebonia sp.]
MKDTEIMANTEDKDGIAFGSFAHGPPPGRAIARALLGTHDDPLREAKAVLRRPGPLSRSFYP